MEDKSRISVFINRLIKFLIALIILFSIAYIAFLKIPKSSVAGKKVDQTVLASDIYNEFLSDENTAQEKYMGKIVEVFGTLDETYTDEQNASVVILKDTANNPIALITLELSESKKILNFKAGDKIKLKALCTGNLMEVTFNKGIILEE